MDLKSVTTPTLLLNPDTCRPNIERMVSKANTQNVVLRPHFKTHQSHQIGEWFRSAGVSRITVSSLGMAEYFSQYQWEDITVAFPVNILEIEAINSLASRISLGLLVLDTSVVETISTNTKDQISIWIKIDVGTHRTGIHFEDRTKIEAILDAVKKYPNLTFKGFLAHAGHSYHKRSKTEIIEVYNESLSIMLTLKAAYLAEYSDLEISLGDTPTASVVKEFGAVDEIRPGNFVFYDLMQEQIGACTPRDIAVALACPVVATHPDRNQWVIYGGGIHFSKDYILDEGKQKCFGRMVDFSRDAWSTVNLKSNPYIVSLSQEHGVVQCNDETFHLRKPGDLSLWLPVHSCMTAEAIGSYLTTDGSRLDHYRQHLRP